jgi:pyruvate formate lyase activating enzyme
MEQVARFAADLGNVERVDVLPFHQMGRFKWHQLGIPYTLEKVTPPEPALVDRACAVFRSAGLQAH